MSTSPDLASPDIVATPHWRLRIKPTRADPRIFVALAIAVALHIALGFVLARIDSLRDETPTAAQEIPVEIVEEPPAPDVKSEQQSQSSVSPSREQTEAQAQQEAADAAPRHAEKSPEPLQSPPQEMSQTQSLEHRTFI